MKREKYIGVICLLLLASFNLFGQDSEKEKKVWASGMARSVFQQNNLIIDNDTVTPKKLNSGHTLVDLAINAKPNDQTFLHGMVRIRNDFGGFWGSGVTFDIRQLYVKGLISNAIRYQLGDLNYKLSPYTFYSNDEELSDHQSAGLSIFRDMVRYDMFYTDDNTWRQQGAAIDFGLSFEKGIEELQFNIFASGNKASDFSQQNDRIFIGGNTTLVQSKGAAFGVNYIDLMDIAGTSSSQNQFHNPVLTGTSKLNKSIKKVDLQLKTESGISEMYEINSSNNKLRDFFYDLELSAKPQKMNLELAIGYINVGPQFRSVGAQSKRLNFQALNLMYGRYGNGQATRPISQLDASQDASLYQLNFNPGLQMFSPAYDNITPYGKATPNRKGLNVEIKHEAKNKLYALQLDYRNLREVVGQGSSNLRKFTVLGGSANLLFDRILKNYEKSLELSLGYTSNSTERTTVFSQADVNLKSSIFDLGVKVGLVSNFELLANYRAIAAKGDELLSIRNSNTEVIDFASYSTDLKENLMLFGLRYNFTEKNALDVVWQKINWEDKNSNSEKYGMSQFAVVYKLKF